MGKVREIDIDIEKLNSDILASSKETNVYIGSDSKTFKKGNVRYVAFCTTVIIHKDGKHGGVIHKDIKIERDFGDVKAPRLRLMNEVYRVVDIANEIIDSVGERHFEIHLDISPDPKNKSNAAIKEACGYVFGVCGVEAKTKPFSWAASCAADRFAVKTANHAKRYDK